MTVFENLAKNLRDLRLEEGVTQQFLADKMNISRANLGRYEVGINVPPLDVICKYADFFGVTVDYILGRTKQ